MSGADAKATFAVELDTTGVQKPGDEAADVLERLKSKILDDNKALAALSQAMRNLKAGATPNIAAIKQLKDQIAAQKQSLSSAQADYIKLGGNLRALAKKSGEGESGIKSLSAAADIAGGPLGRMIRGAESLKGRLAPGGLSVGAILAAAAVVALTAAIVAAAAAFVSFGLASADAARSELLHLQGLTTIRNWFGIAAGKATDLRDAINGVSQSSALGRDKISGYAEQLYKMGLRGDALNDALDATAIKASVQGDQWASLFMSMAAGANMTGQSVKKLADDVRTRLGGIAKAQAMGLGVQLSKLHENVRALFQDVKIEGFLSSLHEVTSLFSQSTVTGKALKLLVQTILTPFSSALGTLGPYAKRFFQGMVLGALDFAIVAVKAAKSLGKMFGDSKLFSTKDALDMGTVSIQVFLGAVVTLAAAVAALGAAFQLVFFTIPKIVGEALADAVFWVVNIKWGELGMSIVHGIVGGIKSAAGALVDAVKGLGTSALKTLSSVWDSHSPSRKFFKLGFTAPQGIVGAVKAGMPEVQRSVEAMVSIPSSPASASTNIGGTSNHFSFPNMQYHAAQGESAQSSAQNFVASLSEALERLGIQMGAPV